MLKIKDISSDEFTSLEDYTPPDSGFAILIEIEIGLDNNNRADLFRFTLCDEKGLVRFIINNDSEYDKSGILSLKEFNIFVVKNYNYNELIARIEQILNKVYKPDKSWKEMAIELNCFFYWEYQNEII